MDRHTTDTRSYMEALEEERRKIQVFQRELPLCMELMTQAIDSCKKQFEMGSVTTEECNRESEIMMEFIPIKRVSTDYIEEVVDAEDDKKKSDWLRSVSLWDHEPDNHTNLLQGDHEESTHEKRSSPVGNGGESDIRVASPPGSYATSSSANTSSAGGTYGRSDDGQTTRKQRRCWSAELHRRFVHALKQLGGSQVATPKQIRDRMKVDGLTNDEVKSHLQKYRLNKKPAAAARSNGDAQSVPSQFVVFVGGSPPPPRPATGIAANRIYAPVAAAPLPQQKRLHHEDALMRMAQTSEETTTKNRGGATDSSSTVHTIRVC